MVIFLLCFIIICVVAYIIFGPLPWYISKYCGDYPGPFLLNNNPGTNKGIDYLLLHGASLDARAYDTIIKEHKELNLAALSLGDQHLGPQYADPVSKASADIIKFLETNKINHGIVGHSLSAIWLSEAFKQRPDLFSFKKIILLCPMFGNISEYLTPTMNILFKIKYIFPDPYWWRFVKIKACMGLGEEHYEMAKKHYFAGKKFRISSLSYYENLIKYIGRKETRENILNFLQNNKNKIKIILSNHDTTIDNDEVIKIADELGLNVSFVSECTHHSILMFHNLWL